MSKILSGMSFYFLNHIINKIPSHFVRLLFYRHVYHFMIGHNSSILIGTWFASKGFKMGSNSVINQNCRIDNRGIIEIGDNVSISWDVCILTAYHDPQSQDFDTIIRPVRIDDYVFVGTRAMILPGVTLGRGAFVAAGAVVTKDVEPFSIVAGCPAKKIGDRNNNLNYRILFFPLFQ